MRKPDLKTMEFDELWRIHEELTVLLSERILAEKRQLEKRLAQLSRVEISKQPSADRAPRRKYPKVLPKYFNPLSPSETWAGRGKQPRWLVAALQAGRHLDEFKIANLEEVETTKRARRRNRS